MVDEASIEQAEPQGWAFPGLSRKWHYFIHARSLCGKWFFAGVVEKGKDDSPDNCAECRRLVKRRT